MQNSQAALSAWPIENQTWLLEGRTAHCHLLATDTILRQLKNGGLLCIAEVKTPSFSPYTLNLTAAAGG